MTDIQDRMNSSAVMKATYSQDVDVAYLQLVESMGEGESARSIVAVREVNDDGPVELNIDLDVQGRLIGIEVLNASAALRPETLATFAWTDGD